jgi:hypothetical protein
MSLEPSDLELKNPTIVMSVRLDNQTARRLHVMAKLRGVNLSDLLREAAVHYLSTAVGNTEDKYVVTGAITRLAVGGVSARYETQPPFEPSTATWGEPQPLRVVPTAHATTGR